MIDDAVYWAPRQWPDTPFNWRYDAPEVNLEPKVKRDWSAVVFVVAVLAWSIAFVLAVFQPFSDDPSPDEGYVNTARCDLLQSEDVPWTYPQTPQQRFVYRCDGRLVDMLVDRR
jgi:hypothetical protein